MILVVHILPHFLHIFRCFTKDCEPIFNILDSDHGAGDALVPLVKLQVAPAPAVFGWVVNPGDSQGFSRKNHGEEKIRCFWSTGGAGELANTRGIDRREARSI